MPDTSPRRPTRLYRIDITPAAGGETTTRLVRAKTDRGAVAHVTGTAIACRAATPDDAYELACAGVVLEIAGEDGNAPEMVDHDPAGAAPGED